MTTLSIILGTICFILFLCLKGVTKMRDNDFKDLYNVILAYNANEKVEVGSHPKSDVHYHALRTAIVSMLKENRRLEKRLNDKNKQEFMKSVMEYAKRPEESFTDTLLSAIPEKVYPRLQLNPQASLTCKVHNCLIGGLVCQSCPEMVEYDKNFIRCKRLKEAVPTLKYRSNV